MAKQATIPQHPLVRVEVIRALVESHMLSGADLLALALVSKAVFRLVYLERRRDRIRTVPFVGYPRNPVSSAIDADDRESLEEDLKLSELDKNADCPNGQLLRVHGGSGIHLLMSLCIQSGALRCLGVLMKLAADPATPFNFSLKWLYNKAQDEALRYGRLEVLLWLHDCDKDHTRFGPPDALYKTLLKQARSPAAIGWLARRLPHDTDYLPILVTQCANKYAQPAVLEVLIDLVPHHRLSSAVSLGDSESSSDSGADDSNSRSSAGKPTTALCAAASALHVQAIDILLRSGALGFQPPSSSSSSSISSISTSGSTSGPDTASTTNTNHPNPLFTVLAHPLPTMPSLSLTTPDFDPDADSASAQEIALQQRRRYQRRLADWRAALHRLAAPMHAAVAYLVDAAASEYGRGGRHARDELLLSRMLDRAAVGYAHALRGLLLASLGGVLSAAGGDRQEDDDGCQGKGFGNGSGDNKMDVVELARKLLCKVPAGAVASAWRAEPDAAVFFFPGEGGKEEEEGKEEPAGGESRVEYTWRPGLCGSWVRARLRDAGVWLPAEMEEVWNLLLTPTTAELAARYLVFRADTSAPRNSVDLLWDLLVAVEKGAPAAQGAAQKGKKAVSGEKEAVTCREEANLPGMSSSGFAKGKGVAVVGHGEECKPRAALSVLIGDGIVELLEASSDSESEGILTPLSEEGDW